MKTRQVQGWRVIVAGAVLLVANSAGEEWHVKVEGHAKGKGTLAEPWDLLSVCAGGQEVKPGDIVWVHGGRYRHPDRGNGKMGFEVKLAGTSEERIELRGVAGERATIDGGLSIQEPATYLWVRDLEIVVSENFSMPRRIEEGGSHPQSYGRPWGGLNVYSGRGCKFIHLVIHDNAQGVSWWSGSRDSELYGSIIYNNGWDAPDRGHGHAVYTQNEGGTKTIADCIMTGGYGYTMHAYGSSRAYVNNYAVEHNVVYEAGRFLIGGGRPSEEIKVLTNFLYQVDMQLGYSAPHNENCEVRGNVIVNGGLQINKFREVERSGNLVLSNEEERPTGARVILRPSRYDDARANLVIYNWARAAQVEVDVSGFMKAGERYRLLNPTNFFGEPVVTGRNNDGTIPVPVKGEFAAYVLLK